MTHKNYAYTTLTGRTIDLGNLNDEERHCLTVVVKKYQEGTEWTQFASWWMGELSKRHIRQDSPLFKVCDDLEARLGVSQGKTSPPDYRDYLLALIEERFGSRYKFCKDTGVDQGQLSRILAGKADFSMELLQKILQALHAGLVVQTEDKLRDVASPEEASRLLETAGA